MRLWDNMIAPIVRWDKKYVRFTLNLYGCGCVSGCELQCEEYALQNLVKRIRGRNFEYLISADSAIVSRKL